MAIRRIQPADEPIVVHRITISPKTHPNLHRALNNLGLGKNRTDFMRDHLESILSGAVTAPKGAEPAPQGRYPGQPEYPVPTATATPVARLPDPLPAVPITLQPVQHKEGMDVEPEETPEELERRRRAASALFRQKDF